MLLYCIFFSAKYSIKWEFVIWGHRQQWMLFKHMIEKFHYFIYSQTILLVLVSQQQWSEIGSATTEIDWQSWMEIERLASMELIRIEIKWTTGNFYGTNVECCSIGLSIIFPNSVQSYQQSSINAKLLPNLWSHKGANTTINRSRL